MGLRFIFMLTRNDRTDPDASQQLQTALSLGVRHIGFKDIGLPLEQLKGLNAAIRTGGATSYLEVVSLDRESEIVSAKAAAEIGVDVLLGGTRVDDVLPIIKGTGIQYFPFPGRITGHPSVLEGAIEEIVESAKTIAGRDGVHGLDLLAYRSAENVPELIKAVCAAVTKPVYIAGSIDTPERIAVVQSAGAAGFTIGTAALDGKYPANGNDLPSQLTAIIRDVAALNKHLSPIHKKNLSTEFAELHAPGMPKVEVQADSMQIEVATVRGTSNWSFRQHDEQLFFVHRGRLLMKLRDREEIIEPGEFIVVPHGVEHCAVDLGGEGCEVLLATSTTPPSCPAVGKDPTHSEQSRLTAWATVPSARLSVQRAGAIMTVPIVLHRADGAPVATSFRRAAFGKDDPFVEHREIAWEGPDAMIVGRTSFIGELEVASFPHIETIVVVEGELILTAAGVNPLVLGPQAGAVIGCGTALRIEAESGVRFSFCAVACDRPAKGGLVQLRADADFKPSASLPAEALVGPAPQCRSDNVFSSDGADYRAGTWDSTPYHRVVRPHRQNEFMHLLAGSVRFAAPDGSVLSAGTGDALFVPQGASIGWESTDRVAKFFVVQGIQA